ncbi:MAG TPA: ABC transporter ATP-binding protein [Syntrophomonadaceae bacterium]|nr:ABC transporter ATP-binding protein [Syntrophomonadaceae bacterium]
MKFKRGSSSELVLKNIFVSLGDQLILDDVNLVVKKGELVSLLGPSGCGKTTMLKTISGLLQPDRGDIFMDDVNVTQETSCKRGAVIVFQDLRLFPNMTVEENVAYPLKLQGIDGKKRRDKVQKLLENVQLDGYEKRSIYEISGGQVQRVALARAVAANPNILLLDEPFSSLDGNLREDMRELLLNLHRTFDITTVLVTHDQQEALMMSDRIAVMGNGQIIQYDSPAVIYNQPANKEVADYFGGGNYITGRVKQGVFRSEQLTFPVAKADGLYQALFRPSALKPISGANYSVQYVRYLGESWQIEVERLGSRLLLSLPSDYYLKPGDLLDIEFDLEKVVMIA